MNEEFRSESDNAEWQAQERALDASRRGARASGDANMDAYRSVFHAVSQAPRCEPPVDFVERTLRAVREAEVDEHIERWMIRIAGLVAVIAASVFAGPMLLDALHFSAVQTMPAAGMFVSPLLWAAIAGVAAAALVDFWQTTWHQASH